ncbi:MAG TPA: alpha/beta hydrolase [Vicinamibacterales bacterium]|nr:alpha/beta hydrolase [Vicinamibacterales bacterium]
MELIDRGKGPALIVIPGVQGRWEYAEPAIAALAERFRVITFALAGEGASGLPFDEARGLDNYVDQISAVMRDRKLERAAICGISFGGLAALRFAAAAPERTSALVLVSTPGPPWNLKRRHRLYLRLPWIFMPLFLAETPLRLRRELKVALPSWRSRVAFEMAQAKRLWTAPISVGRMAQRGRLLRHLDVEHDCASISAPTLVITGDGALDLIVPVVGTERYARMIDGAQQVTIGRTGHLGCNTRPGEFARLVHEFVSRRAHAAA